MVGTRGRSLGVEGNFYQRIMTYTYGNVIMKPIVLHAKVKILIIKKRFVFVNVKSLRPKSCSLLRHQRLHLGTL